MTDPWNAEPGPTRPGSPWPDAPSAVGYGPPTGYGPQPGYAPPTGYGPPPGWGGPPPQWGSPPGPGGGPRPGSAARRALAAVAVVVLVLVSGGIGAIVSAAVHNNSTPAVLTPFEGRGASTLTAAQRAIAAKVDPAIVDVNTTIRTRLSAGEAAGTGMVITPDGEILTNNHVIADATTIHVTLANGDTHPARVVGYDVTDDVALLQIDNVSNLPTVSLGDAAKLALGDAVIAIGNAGGHGGAPTVTTGAVTALDQQVTAGDSSTESSETLHGMIQASAPIEPGDSGGALVDSAGRVIGMNTAASASDRFFGRSGASVSFAIPIDKAIAVVHQIESGHDTAEVHVGDRALLGVQVQDVGQAPTAPTDNGAYIAVVEPGSPAEAAGLAPGGVIVSVDGQSIASASDLTSALSSHHAGDRVQVGWVDTAGQRHDATAQLVAGPPN